MTSVGRRSALEGAGRASTAPRPQPRKRQAQNGQKSPALSRLRSRKPASTRRSSATCTRASSLRTSSKGCIATTIWRARSRSGRARPMACRRCRTTSAYGQFGSSRGIYFQDDPAFKGERRELVAADYVYAYKRFFDPRWKSPAVASLSELKMVGMAAAARGRAERQAGVRLRHDRRGNACARPIHDAVQVRRAQPRFIETLATSDLWGAVAREVVEAVRRRDSGASGRDRPVSACRVAALVADRARTQSDLSRSRVRRRAECRRRRGPGAAAEV